MPALSPNTLKGLVSLSPNGFIELACIWVKVPKVPQVLIKVPLFLNFWMRLLPLSATYTLPEESIATPNGALNSPLAEPAEPQVLIKVPPLLNTWTRWLRTSATNTLPDLSRAIPSGNSNWPVAEPSVPQVLILKNRLTLQ